MPRIRTPLAIDISRPLSEQPCHLTVHEAAAYLRRSIRTIAHWEQRGLIRVLRPAGGFPIVPREEVARLLGEAL